MSYSPTTWNTGDTITAAALNNMESGISNAVQFIDAAVDLSAYTIVAGETAATIWAAMQSGIVVFVMKASGSETVIGYSLCPAVDTITVSGGYSFVIFFGGRPFNLSAASGTDYPAYGEDSGGGGGETPE